jgi:hypothetical protein
MQLRDTKTRRRLDHRAPRCVRIFSSPGVLVTLGRIMRRFVPAGKGVGQEAHALPVCGKGVSVNQLTRNATNSIATEFMQ